MQNVLLRDRVSQDLVVRARASQGLVLPEWASQNLVLRERFSQGLIRGPGSRRTFFGGAACVKYYQEILPWQIPGV